jgi:hypothetical protein
MSDYIPRKRMNVYLEVEHVKRLRDLSATKGVSKSAVVAAALASFLSPDAADRREAAIGKRLDRLSHQFERLERDQTILIETLALFIRYELSVSTSIPEDHQDAVRAQGRARFQKFIEQLGRHLQRGGSLVRDLSEEIVPTDKDFFSETDADSSALKQHEETPS